MALWIGFCDSRYFPDNSAGDVGELILDSCQ